MYAYIPVCTRMNYCIIVCNRTYAYIPVCTMMKSFRIVCTSTFAYILIWTVLTRTYSYILVHTRMNLNCVAVECWLPLFTDTVPGSIYYNTTYQGIARYAACCIYSLVRLCTDLSMYLYVLVCTCLYSHIHVRCQGSGEASSRQATPAQRLAFDSGFWALRVYTKGQTAPTVSGM